MEKLSVHQTPIPGTDGNRFEMNIRNEIGSVALVYQQEYGNILSAARELLNIVEAMQRCIQWAKDFPESPKSSLLNFLDLEEDVLEALAKAKGETK